MRYFLKMFTFVKRHSYMYIPGMLLHSSQGFLFALIQSLLVSKISSAVLNGSSAEIIAAIPVLLCAFVAIMAAFGVGYSLRRISIAKSTRDFKAALFKAFINADIESSGHSGEGIAALNTDADTAAGAYDGAAANFLYCVLSIVLSSSVVFAIDYRLGLASLASGGLAFFVQSRFIKPSGKLNEERLNVTADSVKSVSDIFSGGLTIRAFNLQRKAHSNFDAENHHLRDLSLKEAAIVTWQNLFFTIQGWFTLIIAFALGGWMVATGQLDFPSLIMLPQLCVSLSGGMSGIGESWARLQAPASAAKRVFRILEHESVKDTKNRPDITSKQDTEPAYCGNYELNITGLNFKYIGAQSNALSDINLNVKENEMVAFVGASGSGKSTMLRTILGLYERDGLDMRLGGVKYTKNDTASWRRNFAYVDQSCKLFDMTIAENIALGAEGGASQGLIKDSAVLASADAFISALPGGYDSSCGEKGASLSGGQKQRIAIARALCRKAPVLIFDEATSALDAESERNVMETIESLRKDHTILITTHNLNNVVSANTIVVMDAGKVIETGTHNELLKNSRVYKELFARSSPAS